MGHKKFLTMAGTSNIGQQLNDMLNQQRFGELTIENICTQLVISESTIRKKIKSE